MENSPSIAQNLTQIQKKAEIIGVASQRAKDAVQLIAVSKTKPNEAIEEALAAGQTHFGENRMQELQEKMNAIDSNDIIWHMIGTLQSNKIKHIAARVNWIHSAYKESHLIEIDKRAAQHNRVIEVLLQVNISEEEQKSGCEPSEVEHLINISKQLGNIRLRGFMGIAKLVNNPEEIRHQFRFLKELLDAHSNIEAPNIKLDQLSMGMTNDMEVAIQEGATMIRVGRAIFGERNYT